MFPLTTNRKLDAVRLVQAPLLLARRLIGRGVDAFARRGGIDWHLDLGEGIDFVIYLCGRFEPRTARVLAGFTPLGGVVCDIGANIGAHTLPLVGSAGRVFAFEPTARGFAKLRANLALNPELAHRVTAEQILLADTPDAEAPAELFASWPLARRERGDRLHGGVSWNTAGARVDTFDRYLAAAGVARLDLIKLDVDGTEYEVLNGAHASLARWRPAIVTELAPYVLDQKPARLERLIAMLKGFGYRLLDESGDRALPESMAELRALIPAGCSRNIKAVPPAPPLHS